MGIGEVVLYERKVHDLPCHQSDLDKEGTCIVICCHHPSRPLTHTHVNGHEQASAPPFLVRLGWEVYIKTDSKCIYNTAPGMMIKDPWGSMATKHTLRMLGVSEAEMPHIRHISLRRRLSDWRFLLLSRILQSGTSREQSNGGWTNKWHTGAKDTWTVLNSPFSARRSSFTF